MKLAPSILAADFTRLGEQVAAAERAGADYMHVDVMDGRFVPNLSMGPVVVEALKSCTRLPLNVHLMVQEPERFIGAFAQAGADHLVVHAESGPNLLRTLQDIRDRGLKAGVGINPATPILMVEDVLPYVDIVLVATVNPGFAGQPFIPESLDKIARLRRLLDQAGFQAEVEVDGGINAETAPKVVKAGATILVAGSAVFNKKEPVEKAMKRLRDSVAGLVNT